MVLIIIVGPPAVGKMTVGQELARLTGLRLFHNHMSIELTHQFFDFGTDAFRRLDDHIRTGVFREVAQSDLKGLIFTLVWDFADPEDEAYIDEVSKIFLDQGGRVEIIELRADLKVRLERNKTENRLSQKATKRDLERSERNLLRSESDHRMHSLEGEFPHKSMFKIDNSQLEASEVAEMIRQRFGL